MKNLSFRCCTFDFQDRYDSIWDVSADIEAVIDRAERLTGRGADEWKEAARFNEIDSFLSKDLRTHYIQRRQRTTLKIMRHSESCAFYPEITTVVKTTVALG